MEKEWSSPYAVPVDRVTWPLPVRAFGQAVSVIFHPLFIPSYLTAYLLYIDPYAFAEMGPQLKFYKIAAVFFSTAFLPFFSVVLMKLLGFIKSIFLTSSRDRIIPYMASMIFYFNIWYVARNLHDSRFLVAMLLAVFLSSIAGLMANIYYKISMHGIAVGATLVLFLWMSFSGPAFNGFWLSMAVLVTGLVCTARLIVSDHRPFDIYSGLVAGAVCQLVAIAFAG